MKCRNCKKEISENEVFCEECKEALKDTSSTEQLEELEELIQERKEVDSLETTKDLTNITDLVKNEVKENSDNEVDVDFKDVKDTKISIIVTVLVIGIVIGACIFGVIWFLNRPKNVKEAPKQVVDYEKIINEYGDIVSKEAKAYIEKNDEIPTWQALSELITYDKYEIVCQTHNVYIDGSVYLQHCKVNNKTVKYTYGTLMNDAKTGKELKIYKIDDRYSFEGEEEFVVGTVVCNTVNCYYIDAFDKYIVVREKQAFYLYNYKNNTLEFGPFDDFKLLNYNNELYGIYYVSNGSNNIYNVSTGKTIKDVKGMFNFEKEYIDTGIQYKYGYAITKDNGYNFINLKTGNVSFTIKENIKSFIEDIKSGILYITASEDNTYKFKVYNSNGKVMFNGEAINEFRILDNSLIVFNDNGFKVYDSKLNIKVTSNNYNKILRNTDGFVVVVDKKVLKIVDYNDSIIASFTKEWSDDYKVFDRSYVYDSEKKILTLTFENTNEEATSRYIRYSYNFGAKLTNEEELDTIE